MGIEVLAHARLRMEAYGVSEGLVVEALLHPDTTIESRSGRLIAQRVLNNTYLLRVVFEKHGETMRVITVYKARRERYEVPV